ncbi:MAG: hypothetical protein ACI9W2_001920 [Gammaproteobacteria bacterium]|jgi:hypothetical protein
MHTNAMRFLRRHPAHTGVIGRHLNGNVQLVRRGGGKQWHVQIEILVFASEHQWDLVLPTMPYDPHSANIVAHPRPWWMLRHPVTPQPVAPHLRP